MEDIKSRSFPSITSIPKVFWPIISILITIILFVSTALFIIPGYIHAKETGEFVGNNTGRFVGKALGSYDGITSGLNDGYENGKKEGLSAKDTEVKIANAITRGGKLEVLSAKVQFKDYIEKGNQYAAMLMFRGNVTFTVDLESATLSTDQNNQTVIILPKPEAKVTIDENEAEIIAEKQRSVFNGKTEDGFDTYINSESQIKTKSTDQIQNYEVLLEMAKESAKTQVEDIASNICNYKPTVVFQED